MPGSKTDTLQGPFEGSRCLAGPGERWGPATIRRVNEDGTFKVEFDVLEMEIMPYWYGVTAAEVSFNDASRWAALFPQISPNGRSFAQPNFHDALASLGYQVTPDKAQKLWDLCCQRLFNVPKEQAASLVLDEACLISDPCSWGSRRNRPRRTSGWRGRSRILRGTGTRRGWAAGNPMSYPVV
jgi:hypothetical protein